MTTSGFAPETLRFLSELANNNNRNWFNDNKARYETEVLDPALRFIDSMRKPLAGIAPNFEAVPTRVGGSLMRVYRDTRFSRDKQPYKTNIGIQFRHRLGKNVHAPGYYLHIDPGSVFVGVGCWHPERTTLDAIRERILAYPDDWKRAIRNRRFRRFFSLAGDSLKRPPRGYDGDHPLIDDIKRKDFIAVRDLNHSILSTPDFHTEVVASFKAGGQFMRFLCAAIDVEP